MLHLHLCGMMKAINRNELKVRKLHRRAASDRAAGIEANAGQLRRPDFVRLHVTNSNERPFLPVRTDLNNEATAQKI